jgi:hypothetical protein
MTIAEQPKPKRGSSQCLRTKNVSAPGAIAEYIRAAGFSYATNSSDPVTVTGTVFYELPTRKCVKYCGPI